LFKALTDDQIILGCKNGEPIAFKGLLQKYAPLMMAVAMRYLRDIHKAEDVLQDSYITIFNQMANYEDRGKLKAWMCKIIVNNCLKELRLKNTLLPLEDINIGHSYESNVLDYLEVEEMLKIVEKLPQQLYVIYNLYIVEGFTHSEIAEMLGIPESSSRVYLTRARLAMKNYFLKSKIS
jgi:RNA polymerase sigma factor (sigma-70 family)